MKQLSLIEKAFFLKKTKLFSDLDLDMLVAIADKLNQDVYDPNEKIFEINQRANFIYFIAKGSVQLTDETNSIELHEESFFGDESLFNEKPRTYKAFCTQPSLILTLSRSQLLSIISESPSVALALLEFYAIKTPKRLLP